MLKDTVDMEVPISRALPPLELRRPVGIGPVERPCRPGASACLPPSRRLRKGNARCGGQQPANRQDEHMRPAKRCKKSGEPLLRVARAPPPRSPLPSRLAERKLRPRNQELYPLALPQPGGWMLVRTSPTLDAAVWDGVLTEFLVWLQGQDANQAHGSQTLAAPLWGHPQQGGHLRWVFK